MARRCSFLITFDFLAMYSAPRGTRRVGGSPGRTCARWADTWAVPVRVLLTTMTIVVDNPPLEALR